MAFYRLTVVSVLILVTSVLVLVSSCIAQGRFDPILSVLKKGDSSGSIVYWIPGKCEPDHSIRPPLPKVRDADSSGTVVDILREMFADDPKMRVTQEPGAFGKVRMFETDVPTDLLDLKIRHISFAEGQKEPTGSIFGGKKEPGGSFVPLRIIVGTPEVQAFVKAHNIELIYPSRLPGNVYGPFVTGLHGDLADLTFSEAIDYATLSHGYWLYGSCTDENGKRNVFLWFASYDPWE